MLMSLCTLSMLVRRCFLARAEEGESVHREEKQVPVWGKYRGEDDPFCKRQPERRGVDWESEEGKEEIVSNRLWECGKRNNREEDDFAEIDLLKKLEEEGIPDAIKGMSKDTQLFCIYNESDSDEDIKLI